MSLVLRRVPFFRELSTAALDELGSRMWCRGYAKGETIFYEGDPGTSMYLVEEGRVKLTLPSADAREVILELVGPGEVFGELSLLDGEPRSADAIATEPSRILMLQREDFEEIVFEHPRLALEFMAMLSQRLRWNAVLLHDAAFQDVPGRLARTILRLADGQATTPRVTQSDLAGLAGTTRETLNKWLGIYQDDRLISLNKGQIVVLDAERLRRRIS